MTTLFDRLVTLDWKSCQQHVATAGGSFYLVAPDIVARNVERLLDALRLEYPTSEVGYSYKTNYQEPLIGAALSAGACSEVVSLQEYRYAKTLGVEDAQIIFNGPGKTDQVLAEVLGREVTLIADSLGELERMEAWVRRVGPARARVGLRVAPELSFRRNFTRFGLDLSCSTQRDAVRAIAQRGSIKLEGLHVHYVGDRSAASFEERLQCLLDLWRTLDLGEPDFIDCGGGYASALPNGLGEQLAYETATLEEYGRRLGAGMRRAFPNGKPRLIIEPGTGILADAGVFVTPVLDTKVINGHSVAIVEGTNFSVNPLRSTSTPIVRLLRCEDPAVGQVAAPVRVYGNSCMEVDLLIDGFGEQMAVGDILLFSQKGAYAACMATPFIQGIPALGVLEESGSVSFVRPRTDEKLLGYLNGQTAN